MVKWSKVSSTAFKAFKYVNETIAFYMFIIEEAIQTVSLAIYLSERHGNKEKMKELAQWNKTELINELKEFADGVGYLGFPMNLVYKKFAEASEKAMDYYISIAEEKPPAPTTGSIYIRSNPLYAEIWLDGVNTEKLTPETLSDLEPKTYTITLKKSGYKDYTFEVTVEAGVTKEYYIEMEAE